MSLRRSLLIVPLIIAVLAANVAFAKGGSKASNRIYLAGGYTEADFPLGDWGKIAGFGLGINATNLTVLDSSKPLAIRSSLGFLYNFSRTQDVPAGNIGPTDKLSLETKNGTLYFGVGPELGKISGPIDPFVFGTVGFNTYWTASNLSGTAGGLPYDSKFGDSRIAFAWAAGGGIRKHVSHGETAELSVEYRSGGGHMYVLPGEVTTSGSKVNVERKARNTDQLLLRLGTTLGY
jgi:opacity protein-like surface antigen